MTIARPSQGLVAKNGRDIYHVSRVRCVFRARFASCPNLGLQQHNDGQQQTKPWYSNKSTVDRRTQQRCQASIITVQETRTIKVRLCFRHQVHFGQVLKVVGTGPKLGDWKPEQAQELQWFDGHIWTADVDLEPGSYEFKCVVAAGDYILAWEPGPNRILQVPSGVRGLRVDSSWSRTTDNCITVTEPIAAASIAARQKRAAAAKLLAKALAEVNAAVAAGASSAAALAGRTPEEARGGAGGPPVVPAAAAPAPGDSSRALAGTQHSTVPAPAFEELGALLSSESLKSVAVGVASAATTTNHSSVPPSSSGSEGGGEGQRVNGSGAAASSEGGLQKAAQKASTAWASSSFGADVIGDVARGKTSLSGGGPGSVGVTCCGGESAKGGQGKEVKDVLVSCISAVEEPEPAARTVSRNRRDLLSVSVNIEVGQQSVQQEQQPVSTPAVFTGTNICSRGSGGESRPSSVIRQQKQEAAAAEFIAQSIQEAATTLKEALPIRDVIASSRGANSSSAAVQSLVPVPVQSQAESQQSQSPVAAVSPAKAESAAAEVATVAVTQPVEEESKGSEVAAVPLATAVEAPKEEEVHTNPPSLSPSFFSSASPANPATEAARAPADASATPLSAPSTQVPVASVAGGERALLTAVSDLQSAPAGATSDPSRSGDARFAGEALGKLIGLGSGQKSATKPEAKGSDVLAGANGKEAWAVVPPPPFSVGAESNSSSSSGRARGVPWRQLLGDGEQQQCEQQLQQVEPGGEEGKPEPKGADKREEEEGVSVRFTLLLSSQGKRTGPGVHGEQPTQAASTAAKSASSEPKPGIPQEVGKQEGEEPAAAEFLAPATPPGCETRVLPAIVAAAATFAASSGSGARGISSTTTTSGGDSGSIESGRQGSKGAEEGIVKAGDMGARHSQEGRRRGDVESVSNPDLDRFLDTWDAAWTQGRPKQPTAESSVLLLPPAPSPPPCSDNSSNIYGSAVAANGTTAHPPAAVAFSAASNNALAGDRIQSQRGPTAPPAASSAAKLANGGDGSSGESLYSIAERLTGGSVPAAAPMLSSDDSSPGITVRMGAMAAMGVDRQGSYDNRSSYLSQTLLADSVNGGDDGGGGQEQSSTALLRQLRAANAINAAGSAPAPVTASIPNLPATPAPPGILSSVDEDENDGVVPLPLPATPPPPSYLSGPFGGVASAASAGPTTTAAPVPPLPATPVSSSILSSSLADMGIAAKDLLRRVTDADAVLNMLRGNLPLTPIARGGRGGAAGPLSIVEAEEGDAEEDNKEAGGRRSRRSRRGAGARLLPVLPIPNVGSDTQVAPLTAQAMDRALTTLQALQESAAGLGLTQEALSELVARLLQKLQEPADAVDGQAGGATDASSDASIKGNSAMAPPGLPPVVSQFTTTLVTGLGTVGSSLTEQLRKAGAVAASASATAILPGAAASSTEATNGTTAAVAAVANGRINDAVANGNGAASLQLGCLRLVAGAHMIPHVDKVDKGGEDAYFISRVGLGGVGVADGVSGWADEGIDPAEYPRTLMRYAADAFEAARGTMSAQDIIRYAQYRTYLKGSSTVCMALMKPGRKLEVANVGDSGVRILRNGKVIFGTEAQQHAFNMPYQLSHPNNVEDPDDADDADVHLVDVQEGDLIMLATDGLFDNVFDEEIEQIVSQQQRELAAAGRDRAQSALATVSAMVTAGTAVTAATATNGDAVATIGGSSCCSSSSSGGGSVVGGGRGSKGLLSQSFSAAAAAAAAAAASGGAAAVASGGGLQQYRPEDAARVARALAERAHQHARNPTQRTPWSVTSSQQPNFMWAKFFAKGGGKMDDCTVLVAFVCGPE